MISRLVILLFTFVFAETAFAQTVLVIEEESVPVYYEPKEDSKVRTRLKKGRRLKSAGVLQNGFYSIKTKSGRTYWVSAKQVTIEGGADEFEEAPPPAEVEMAQNRDFSRWTYDLGASTGKFNDVSYTEVNLGLNYFFKYWLAWRNAIWARFASGQDTVFGLDSSIRGIYAAGNRGLGLTAFAGPGLRIPSRGRTVPFAEAGLIFKLGGFSIGGGAKVLFYEMTSSNLDNDTQLFIILAGAGSL